MNNPEQNPNFKDQSEYVFSGTNGDNYRPQINGPEYREDGLNDRTVAAQVVLAREAASPAREAIYSDASPELGPRDAAALIGSLGNRISGYREEFELAA